MPTDLHLLLNCHLQSINEVSGRLMDDTVDFCPGCWRCCSMHEAKADLLGWLSVKMVFSMVGIPVAVQKMMDAFV